MAKSKRRKAHQNLARRLADLEAVVSLEKRSGVAAPGEKGPLDAGTSQAPDLFDSVGPAAFDISEGSWNIGRTPRQETGRLQPFQLLKNLSRSNDVLHSCISYLQEVLSSLEFAIIPNDPDLANDPMVRDLVLQISRFFERPNRVDRMSWPEWFKGLVWETYVTDALTIDPIFDRIGRPHSFAQIDGATIKIQLDDWAHIPSAPMPAYQQILQGRPAGEYSTDELYYRPSAPRTDSPYGESSVERIMTHVLTGTRRWAFNLDFYNESTLPQVYFETPPGEGIKGTMKWVSLLNDIVAAKMGKRFKFVPLPTGANIKEVRTPVWSREQDEWIARVICFELGVNPLPLVAMMNRATAEVAETIQYDSNIQGKKRFFESVMDDLIRIGWGAKVADLVRFQFVTDKTDISLTRAQTLAMLIDKGVMLPSEVREDSLGLAPEESIRALAPAPAMLAQQAQQQFGQSPPSAPGPKPGEAQTTFNELTLALQRAKQLDDEDLINEVRKKLAEFLGIPELRPLDLERPVEKRGDEFDERMGMLLQKAAREELSAWHRVAKKDLDRARSFRTEVVSGPVTDFLRRGLSMATNEETVETLFKVAKSEVQSREETDPKFLAARRRIAGEAHRMMLAEKPRIIEETLAKYQLEQRRGGS